MAKTANIGRLSVSLEANTAKYTQKLKKAKKTSKTNTDGISKDFASMGKKSAASFAVVAVAAVVAVNEAKKLAEAYVQVETELRGLAEAAGLTTKELKANAYALAEAGLSAEKLGDIYKDVRDKTGEFAAAGSGAFQDFVDVMKMTKGEGRKLAQELQYMSGDEVLGYMAKEMQKAKVSGSQMTFVLESMGSDASKAAKLLTENAEATKNLREEYGKISREADAMNIKSFEEANKQTDLLFSNLGALATDALAPAMNAYASLIKNINKILPESAQSKQKNFGIDSRKELENQYKSLSLQERQAKIKEELHKKISDITFKQLAAESKAANMQKKIDDDKLAREKRKTNFNDFTKQESNSYSYNTQSDSPEVVAQLDASKLKKIQQEAANYEAQIKSLQTEVVDLGSVIKSTTEDTIRSQSEGKKELDKMFLGAIAQTPEAIGEQWAVAEQEFKNNYKALYGETQAYTDALDRLNKTWGDKQLNAQKALSEAKRMEELKAQTKSYQDAQDFFYLKSLILDDEMELMTNRHEIEMLTLEENYSDKLGLESEFLAAKAALQIKHDEEVAAARKTNEVKHLRSMNAQAGHTEDLFNNLGTMMAAFGDESSRSAQAMFAIAKGAAVAQAIINGYLAASEAWADPTLPFMAKAAAAVGAVANVAGLISSIKSTQVQGQAHSGLNAVPESHDNGTFLLKAGERVVQPEANKDLTAYLNGKKQEESGGGSVIKSDIVIHGSVTDEAWFQKHLIKHREVIAGAVNKVKKERPLRG